MARQALELEGYGGTAGIVSTILRTVSDNSTRVSSFLDDLSHGSSTLGYLC